MNRGLALLVLLLIQTAAGQVTISAEGDVMNLPVLLPAGVGGVFDNTMGPGPTIGSGPRIYTRASNGTWEVQTIPPEYEDTYVYDHGAWVLLINYTTQIHGIALMNGSQLGPIYNATAAFLTNGSTAIGGYMSVHNGVYTIASPQQYVSGNFDLGVSNNLTYNSFFYQSTEGPWTEVFREQYQPAGAPYSSATIPYYGDEQVGVAWPYWYYNEKHLDGTPHCHFLEITDAGSIDRGCPTATNTHYGIRGLEWMDDGTLLAIFSDATSIPQYPGRVYIWENGEWTWIPQPAGPEPGLTWTIEAMNTQGILVQYINKEFALWRYSNHQLVLEDARGKYANNYAIEVQDGYTLLDGEGGPLLHPQKYPLVSWPVLYDQTRDTDPPADVALLTPPEWRRSLKDYTAAWYKPTGNGYHEIILYQIQGADMVQVGDYTPPPDYDNPPHLVTPTLVAGREWLMALDEDGWYGFQLPVSEFRDWLDYDGHWLVGDTGLIYEPHPTFARAWVTHPSPTTQPIRRVEGNLIQASQIGSGPIYEWNGTAWNVLTIPGSRTIIDSAHIWAINGDQQALWTNEGTGVWHIEGAPFITAGNPDFLPRSHIIGDLNPWSATFSFQGEDLAIYPVQHGPIFSDCTGQQPSAGGALLLLQNPTGECSLPSQGAPGQVEEPGFMFHWWHLLIVLLFIVIFFLLAKDRKKKDGRRR